jgi:hypothetical protein
MLKIDIENGELLGVNKPGTDKHINLLQSFCIEGSLLLTASTSVNLSTVFLSTLTPFMHPQYHFKLLGRLSAFDAISRDSIETGKPDILLATSFTMGPILLTRLYQQANKTWREQRLKEFNINGKTLIKTLTLSSYYLSVLTDQNLVLFLDSKEEWTETIT